MLASPVQKMTLVPVVMRNFAIDIKFYRSTTIFNKELRFEPYSYRAF